MSINFKEKIKLIWLYIKIERKIDYVSRFKRTQKTRH